MIIGLQVKMVTGDQLAIGKETSRRLGLGNYERLFLVLYLLIIKKGSCHMTLLLTYGPAGTDFVEGKDIMRTDMRPEELGQKILHVDGFAGVYPEHKHRIVQALQARGMLIGMTGMLPCPVDTCLLQDAIKLLALSVQDLYIISPVFPISFLLLCC